jgi:PPOX class probable F420-dependent enzyme
VGNVAILSPTERAFLTRARQGILATLAPPGRPRLVPVCFVLDDEDGRADKPVLYSAIDDKPKASSDPHRLGRVRDLVGAPLASVLVAPWDEDWSRLGWLRVDGRGTILEAHSLDLAEHRRAVDLLRAKYPQYASHRLEERPVIRIAIVAARSWGNLTA